LALASAAGDASSGGNEGSPQPARRPKLRAISGGADPSGSSTLTALVVEDDPAMRMLCAFNLEAAGFEVVTAASGEEAVRIATTGDHEFDVVLLDVMLPGLGGFEIAHRLRGVPVVFMSARTSSADIESGREAGGIDYITKPFDPVGLGERLREDLEALRQGGAESVRRLRFGEPGR
jgi:DNA-binding response OmpR family regulator